MAVEIRKTIINAIRAIRNPNTFILDKFFPVGKDSFFPTAQVQWDLKPPTQTVANFGSFKNSANVYDYGDFLTITVPALPFNEKIIENATTTTARGYAQPQFISGGSDTTIILENDLTQELVKWSELKDRILRKVIISAYEALTTGKIALNLDGVTDVVFGVPDDNIAEVATDWADENAKPIDDILLLASITKSNIVILGKNAFNAFKNNPNIRFGNDANGRGANIERPTSLDARIDTSVFFVGTTIEKGIKIYVDEQQYIDNDNNYQYALHPDKVVFGSSNGNVGNLLFGGVPLTRNQLIATDYLPVVNTQDEPVLTEYILRSAQLPAIRNPYNVGCLTVTES